MGSAARLLEGCEEVAVGHVLLELCHDCSFQALAEERKVEDRLAVSKVTRVQTSLLQVKEAILRIVGTVAVWLTISVMMGQTGPHQCCPYGGQGLGVGPDLCD